MSIYLKKVNYEDLDKEYEAIISIPEDENGMYLLRKHDVSRPARHCPSLLPRLCRVAERAILGKTRVTTGAFRVIMKRWVARSRKGDRV